MANSKEFIATNSIQFVNDTNKNLIGSMTIDASGNIVFTDDFTVNTYKFDQPDTKIGNLTLKDLGDFPTGINVDELGQISFTDTKASAYLSNIVTDIDVVQLLDKLNTIGSIYDFRIRQMTFGDYKYANVKFCTDIANTFGYFSVDKLMNDERARQIFQNEQAAIYKGTAQEALFPPYAGFLADQNYQVDGWINIDHLVHLALNNNFGYDDSASFSVRTKPFQDAKRVIIMMVLNYVNDMFSLGSFNKLSDFGVRIIDRNTDQEIDLCQVQTNVIGQIGSNILATYVGPLKYDLTRTYDNTVPHVKSLDVNKCDKKYINKCDGVIFTLKDEPEKEDSGCPVCYRHELGVEIRVNPHADTRINKIDIQNTIDPIHWTTGLVSESCSLSGDRKTQANNVNYDLFKNLVDEFGKKSYTVGSLNESRAFAGGVGDVSYGLVAGGVKHVENQVTAPANSTESWNGTSWCIEPNGQMPVGRAFGILGGGYKQAVYAFGATPSISALYQENQTVVWNGTSWFTASPYTFSPPNLPRHSTAGKLDIQITLTDENKTPLKSREEFMPHTLFNDNFLMPDTDFYKLVALQNPDQNTNWYALTRFYGFAFGGRTDNNFDLFNVTDSDVTNVFEFVSWGGMTRYTYAASGASMSASELVGTWMVDPTRNYPVAAYGVCYVGDATKGLATGGKTGKSPEELSKAYTYPTTFDEYESPILNLTYEYNGLTWIRRDNMPEEVYYHAGVGTLENSIYWGGIHGSMEQPHIYDSLETFEDWEVVINRFGGTNHRNGTYGLDGVLRYALFPTRYEDGNNWYQLGDPNDYIDANKPLLGTTAISGVYEDFIPANVNGVLGNKHTIKVSKIIDESTIQTTTYYDGEAWKSKVIRAGNTKLNAYGEGHDQVSQFDFKNEQDIKESYSGNYIKNPDGTTSDSFVPNGVFAERFNITNGLMPDYAGHTIKGGMWLWSRPTAGENLFHPDNYLMPAGTDVTNHDVVYNYIAHSFNPDVFGPISGDNTLHSFFVDYNTDHFIGLEQFVWQKAVTNNDLTFIEKWSLPSNFEQYFSDNSQISGMNIIVNGKILPANKFPYRKTTSFNRFLTPLDEMLEIDPITDTSELGKFINMQFRTEDTDYNTNVFVYDLTHFETWASNTQGANFHPVSYDGFYEFFKENDGNKVTVSNFVKSSSIRDKAALFPWNDLIGGDATNKAKAGSVTWNWIREPTTENGIAKFNTFLIVAEVIFANIVPPGVYTKPDGTQSITDTSFWREVFKISKFDKLGKEIWSYEITYDEIDTMPETTEPAFWIDSTYPTIGTLFGTSILNRDLNDGISTNETFDISGNKILRTISLWNSKTINPVSDTSTNIANEPADMTYFGWKKIVDPHVSMDMYGTTRSNLLEMVGNDYKLPNTGSSFTSGGANWFLCMPGETFEGMLIADSKKAIMPATRSETTPNGAIVLYNDSTVAPSGAGYGMVKEFISSYSWENDATTWKVVKAYSASPESHGYMSYNYGKSTYPLPPRTEYPINANISGDIVKYHIENVFPWSHLKNDPATYVEMVVPPSGGFWFAYGDDTNKIISESTDTHTNVYHIGHIPVENYDSLIKLPLGKIIYDNIMNATISGGASVYRHKEAIIEMVNTQHGEELFDVFITMTEHNENKPYGTDVPYYPPPVVITPPSSSFMLSPPTSNDPKLFCCEIPPPPGGCLENCGGSGGGGCEIILLTGKTIEESGADSFGCYMAGTTLTSNLPAWEIHNREEWSVPFIESPFAGPFGNADFNVWVSSGKSDTTRWGNLIFNQVPQYGELVANFKAHRIGIDVTNNKIYLSVLTASLNLDKFDKVAAGNVNIPCSVVYDEFIFPTQFASDTLPATGYAALPFIQDIYNRNLKFNKDPGVFCTEPLMVYIPETFGCGLSPEPMFYYTEWGTNFIQEFKNVTTAATDPATQKYFFTHNTGVKHGSSTHDQLPDPNSFDIISTDWRRYQDGVGLGGDIPNLENKNCLPLKQWFVGQTAFGTPDKAVVVGGYVINSGDSTLAPDKTSTWWDLYTTTKTFKWNKGVINPEDMYNKNYMKRNFSPFFSNGENTFSNSSLSYVMFDIGKNVKVERRGTVNFNGDTNVVTVIFDEPIPEVFTTRNMYSVCMTPNGNIKLWWDNKTETGFDIHCESATWVGSVDWSIFYTEDLSKDSVEGSLGEQDTYDKFKNL